MPRVEIGDTAERARNFAGRTWVLERVIAWLDDRNQRILLITGEPGSGKTALAAWLAGGGPAPLESTAQAQLERIRDAWSAAHFCTTDTRRGALDPKAFAQSLARQLGERYPDFAAAALLRAGATLNVEQNITQNLGEAVAVRIENLHHHRSRRGLLQPHHPRPARDVRAQAAHGADSDPGRRPRRGPDLRHAEHRRSAGGLGRSATVGAVGADEPQRAASRQRVSRCAAHQYQ